METKTIQKYKSKSIAGLLNIARTHFNKYIRLRDTDENGWGNCISSGQRLKYGHPDCHAGHFYPSTVSRLRFDPDNVHLQGKSDNYFKSGNQLAYRKNLIKKIGLKAVERLEMVAADKTPFKWDRFFLIETIEKYKRLNKQMLSEKE